MNFRIADTFTDSRVRLTGDEQKAVKTTRMANGLYLIDGRRQTRKVAVMK